MSALAFAFAAATAAHGQVAVAVDARQDSPTHFSQQQDASPGSALYSPFASAPPTEIPLNAAEATTAEAKTINPPRLNDIEPDLTLTLVACLASILALVCLMLRL